ncbi:Lipoprotein LpqB, GerMN domain protein [Thalassoporum mexicanum PCC 7367]|uniref:GerMN domain-containing protein n=1 Tax=Thalassoporum mexicanum TaxID=3457544 RepID=UPI00029FBF92|nr:GerMN domain-containing protein [Pseudanabaena sp. PCC 7367]AFY70931.1 Lipoprotein LpqB, GerMN domain protein [Pseudanabaena sp. PCC 7367]
MSTSTSRKGTWIALIAAGLVGGTASYFVVQNNIEVQPPTIDPDPTVVEDSQPAVYWISDRQTSLVAVAAPIEPAATPTETLTTALNTVFTLPDEQAEMYSAIPPGTELRDVSIDGNDIYLDLSDEFESGGGSAGMTGRVVQVLYTATSINPQANLYLSIEGEPVDYLGGEGLEIPQPMTRSDFSLEF